MDTCKQCKEFEKCKDDAFINGAKFDPNESAKYCTGFEPITNADRIRAMTDEELAELVGKYVYCGLCPLRHRCIAGECNKVVTEWLKQPAEGE